MLKAAAALCQPLNHIIFNRETLLLHSCDDKLCETVVSEVLTRHKVKELICHLRLAVQICYFKAFEWLSLVHFVEFFLNFFKNPWHLTCVSLNIVEFKTLAFELLNLRIKFNFYPMKIHLRVYYKSLCHSPHFLGN